MKIPKMTKTVDGKIYHNIGGVNIRCQGKDCTICKNEKESAFTEWELSIPYPIPPKGKRYKNPIKHKHRGKTIMEICYSCKKIPCYMCSRTKCPDWMKEDARKGQEEGCSSWQQGRCLDFVCDKGIITTHWENEYV